MSSRERRGKFKTQIEAYRNDSPGFFEFFEGFFYELKPFLYIAFSVWIMRSHLSEAWWLKIACLGILIFGFLTFFSRLAYRGYLD